MSTQQLCLGILSPFEFNENLLDYMSITVGDNRRVSKQRWYALWSNLRYADGVHHHLPTHIVIQGVRGVV